jgi:hypothetical protein
MWVFATDSHAFLNICRSEIFVETNHIFAQVLE